jgi:hypothetical protein
MAKKKTTKSTGNKYAKSKDAHIELAIKILAEKLCVSESAIKLRLADIVRAWRPGNKCHTKEALLLPDPLHPGMSIGWDPLLPACKSWHHRNVRNLTTRVLSTEVAGADIVIRMDDKIVASGKTDESGYFVYRLAYDGKPHKFSLQINSEDF